MRIKVKFYGPFDYAVGTREIELNFTENLTLYELLFKLCQRWTKLTYLLGDIKDSSNIANRLTLIVNGQFKELTVPLQDGDEIQILSPISGG